MTRDGEGDPRAERPAQTTEEAYARLTPDEPLASGDSRYVRLDAARGRSNLAESLKQKIQSSDSLAAERGTFFSRLLLTGHRGCGKTTELFRLCDLLSEAGFTVVYFDAEAQFDLFKQDVSWWNIVLEMIWQLDTQLSELPHKLSILEEPKEEAAAWLAKVVTSKQQRVDVEASLETELGADASLPFFFRVKALLTSFVKTGSTHLKTIEIEVERRPEVLLNALEAIVRNVNERLYGDGKMGLVVVVDGLEKIPLRTQSGGMTAHNALFIHNGDKLKAAPCHLVYTMPLALLKQVNVSQIFPDEPDIMPMIHIAEQDGRKDARGIEVMCEVLHKRVSRDLFQDQVEEMLALASGGHIRDFIRLARAAASRFGELIATDHAQAAIDEMIDYYDNLYDADFHEALVSVNQHHELPRRKHDSEIIDRLLVLPYRNANSWYALHPCVLQGPRLRQAKSSRQGKSKSGKKNQRKR